MPYLFLRRAPGRLVGLAALLAVFLTGRPASASQELRQELRDLAAEIKKVLAGENQDSIALPPFGGPSNFPTSSGPGIAQVLAEELQKVGITVKLRAKFGVKGSYAPAELPAANPDDARIGKKVLAIKLTASLVDDFDNPVGNLNFTRVIRGEATFLQLIPVPVSLPPSEREVDRDKKIRDAYTPPKNNQKIDLGSVIRSEAKSPYAIEILVAGKARKATAKEGLAFVPIKRGEAYAVRLINDTDVEAAVQLRIDGLSMFAFSELRHKAKLANGKDNPRAGEPLYSMVIVPPKKSVLLEGWHLNNSEGEKKGTSKFLVTEYAKSGAAYLNHKGNIGTITATFQAAWKETELPPKDEPGKKRSAGSGDATGFGPKIAVKYREVRRNLGVIRAAVSVRYTK